MWLRFLRKAVTANRGMRGSTVRSRGRGPAEATAFGLPAQTLTTLFRFNGTDGANPYAGLIQGTDGDLYGNTEAGGSANEGTIFKITRSGSLTTLYNFCSQSAPCKDGAEPWAGLIQGANGDIYGTTYEGGEGVCSGGCRTLFKITPSGALTTLYDSCAEGCGVRPNELVQAKSGDFYGTTFYGGANASGTVFKITLSGNLTSLYSFCGQAHCTDGAYPDALAGLLAGGQRGLLRDDLLRRSQQLWDGIQNDSERQAYYAVQFLLAGEVRRWRIPVRGARAGG